ncbi:MAG: carboxypeptidase regulatory-like domain-containing protein, partial [Bacteroidia bacterium]
MNIRSLVLFTFILFFSFLSSAQETILRGFVFDESTGSAVPSAMVKLEESNQGTFTDETGFYNIGGLKGGIYTVVARAIGYDSA